MVRAAESGAGDGPELCFDYDPVAIRGLLEGAAAAGAEDGIDIGRRYDGGPRMPLVLDATTEFTCARGIAQSGPVALDGELSRRAAEFEHAGWLTPLAVARLMELARLDPVVSVFVDVVADSRRSDRTEVGRIADPDFRATRANTRIAAAAVAVGRLRSGGMIPLATSLLYDPAVPDDLERVCERLARGLQLAGVTAPIVLDRLSWPSSDLAHRTVSRPLADGRMPGDHEDVVRLFADRGLRAIALVGDVSRWADRGWADFTDEPADGQESVRIRTLSGPDGLDLLEIDHGSGERSVYRTTLHGVSRGDAEEIASAVLSIPDRSAVTDALVARGALKAGGTTRSGVSMRVDLDTFEMVCASAFAEEACRFGPPPN